MCTWKFGESSDLRPTCRRISLSVHSHGHGCSMMRDRYLMPSVARNKQLGNRAPALVRLLVFPSVSAIRNNTKFKWCVEHGIRRKCMPDLCEATLDSPTNLNRFRISNYAAICSAANFACRRGIPSINFIFVGRKDTVSRRQFSGDRLDQGYATPRTKIIVNKYSS